MFIKKYYFKQGNIEMPVPEIIGAGLLFFLLAIPVALAEQQPIDAVPVETSKPAVPVTQQAPATSPESSTQVAFHTTTDFLMAGSPISQNVTAPVPVTPAPAPLPLPLTDTAPKDVALLVSEQCKQGGDDAEGSISCSRIYSNGHHTKVLSQRADGGDEFKEQAVIEEYDKDDSLISTKTVRHRVDYNYSHDQKAKEREFFDIIYQAVGKKTTRELMVYQYYLNTGVTKTLSWTQYKQIGNKPKAALTYHASLRYGTDGSPERGVAEQWSRGRKAATFLDWSRLDGGFSGRNQKAWTQWERWIQNVSLQAYLP